MDATKLSNSELAQHCANETHKYTRQQENDTRFCFELSRRALQDENTDAFTHLYRIYIVQIRNWVYQHPLFAATGEEVDYFVQQAIANFYFALRSSHFQGFSHMSAVLKYLKMCVHTAIAEYIRTQKITETLDEDVPYPSNMSEHIHQHEIWERITQVLTDERDRRLAYYAFALWLKPADIAESYPHEWQDAREVSVALYNVRGVLRRDARLRELLLSETVDI